MRICLLEPGPDAPEADARSVSRLAALLSRDHEVVVIEGNPKLSAGLAGISYAGDEHRRSAAVMEAIRAAYGSVGPEYLEIPDGGAGGLVALQARLGGDPLLTGTLVGVRITPSFELRSFHDRTLSQSKPWRVAELEREQLRLADRLIWPGGDTLDLYRRYYAELDLPEAVRIAAPVDLDYEPGEAHPPPSGQEPKAPLRILFAGDLRRHLGVLDLVEACLSSGEEDWELTLIGADTQTATMGQSVRLTIEAMVGEDPRVRIEDPIAIAELRRRLPGYDLLALPAGVEAWSEVAIEAMRAGLPVLATPVGGLTEIVEDGVSGWLTAGLGREGLGHALGRLLRNRGEVERMRAGGAPARRGRELSDPVPVLAGYQGIADSLAASEVVVGRAREKPVTGVIPYFGVPEFVGLAVDSLLSQTHRDLDVLIVNDGSFKEADSVLGELERDPRVRVVTQPNRGECAARNLAAQLARGEYLMMLDADNMLEPQFVARALAAFEREPNLGYVTSWLRMIDPTGADFADGRGYAPLGNAVIAEDNENWDGDAIAMLPRRLFSELGFFYDPEGSMHSDWELYRWLRRERLFGAVIPERLARYRVRPDSLLHGHGDELQDWSWAESRSRNLQRRMRWVAD